MILALYLWAGLTTAVICDRLLVIAAFTPYGKARWSMGMNFGAMVAIFVFWPLLLPAVAFGLPKITTNG